MQITYLPQALYYSSWDKVLRFARSFHTDIELRALKNNTTGGNHGGVRVAPCAGNVDKAMCDVLEQLDDVKALQNLANVFTSGHACFHVTKRLASWQSRVASEIRAIKPFVKYL
jgi:hypothetical protein